MFGMTVPTTAIVLTVLLAVIALAYLLFGWLRKRSGRVMLRGLGFILMPIGLLVMGLMSQIVTGINHVVTWAQTTVMSLWIMIGLIVAGAGLLFYLVGSFIPHISGEEAAKRRDAIRDKKLAALQGGRPAAAPKAAPTTGIPSTSLQPAAPSTSGTVKPVAGDATGDDKEVDDILRRHGIN